MLTSNKTNPIRTKITEAERAEGIRVLAKKHGFPKTAEAKHKKDFVGMIESNEIVVETYREHLRKTQPDSIATHYLNYEAQTDDVAEYLAGQEHVLYWDMGTEGMYCWVNSIEMRKAFGKK